jgi:hypothetical protein
MSGGPIFYETDHVDYVGDGLDGIPPAQGRIVAFASQSAAHVLWENGPREGGIDIVSLHDLEKSAALETVEPKVTAPMLVRRVMKREGSAGVLRYLATNHQLDSWADIARDVEQFVESRLRVDASMELPYELLDPDSMELLIVASRQTLLRDMFSEVPGETSG